jgi:hypothetical protein
MSPALEWNSSSISGFGQRVLILLAAALGCVGLAYLSLQALPKRDISSWPVSQGHVTAMRTRVNQIRDANHGRVAALQAEILVSYNATGKTYLRWFSLPARTALSQQQISDKPAQLEGTVCTVHWKQNHPFEAFVTEYQEY